jgi:cobalamin biosynthesis protein CobT
MKDLDIIVDPPPVGKSLLRKFASPIRKLAEDEKPEDDEDLEEEEEEPENANNSDEEEMELTPEDLRRLLALLVEEDMDTEKEEQETRKAAEDTEKAEKSSSPTGEVAALEELANYVRKNPVLWDMAYSLNLEGFKRAVAARFVDSGDANLSALIARIVKFWTKSDLRDFVFNYL